MSEDFSLLDRIPMGAFVISRDYAILYWNICMEGWTDIRSSEALGRDLRELFPKFRDPAVASRLDTAFGGGPPVVLSYQLHGDIFPRSRPTLVPRARQCTASYLPSVGGVLFSVEDRTDIAAKSREARSEHDRREAVEKELRWAIQEKEMLMRELNHRVKNNLHMVQSLIGLESSSLPEGVARERLAALETRVNSISALHDSLGRTKAGSDIPAAEYLASIGQHLLSAFMGAAEGPRLSFELENLALPSEKLLYLGLAVNELVTNSIKYGGKRIALALKSGPGGSVEVTVSDDGPGFPTPISTRPDSLGLRLVAMLAEQMGGSLETDGTSGALFRIRIP
jgi:two-component sensor histidine kinase